MDKKLPFVSVIIPTFHDWGCLQRCIDAVGQQTYPPDRYELVVVNNDPDDHPPQELTLPENATLVNERKPGSYAARNKGINIARGEILAFTDADCIPAVDWLEKAVERLVKGTERVGGCVELFYRSSRLTLAERFEKAFAFRQEYSASNLGVSVTANMFVWRRCFEKLGLFDDSLLSGGDTEWGERANAAGINIAYSPNVVVRHPARHHFRDLLDKHRRIAGGQVQKRVATGLWGFAKRVLVGLLPPVSSWGRLGSRRDLGLMEKIVAWGLLYYLNIYITCQEVLLILKLREPKRS